MGTKYIVQLWKSIKKRRTNIICMTLAIAIYCFNQLIFKRLFAGGLGYFCKCYLNDLVCPLFFLSYSQMFLIWAEHEIKTYSGLIILGMAAGCVWEFFAPIVNHRAVTDGYDLICYFCGIQIYYFIAILEQKYWTVGE